MTLTIAALLLGLLTAFCYSLVRTASIVQNRVVIPFLYRMHMPNAMSIITEEEHDIIHHRVDIFNLRALVCFIGSIIAVGLALFFIFLVQQGGNAQLTGTFMAVTYAMVIANYNISSSIVNWIRAVESDLLARVIVDKQEASKFDTLGEYLENENRQMVTDYYKEMEEMQEEFDQVAEECGLDPEKNYDETETSFREFLTIMDNANTIMRERHPDKADKFQQLSDE